MRHTPESTKAIGVGSEIKSSSEESSYSDHIQEQKDLISAAQTILSNLRSGEATAYTDEEVAKLQKIVRKLASKEGIEYWGHDSGIAGIIVRNSLKDNVVAGVLGAMAETYKYANKKTRGEGVGEEANRAEIEKLEQELMAAERELQALEAARGEGSVGGREFIEVSPNHKENFETTKWLLKNREQSIVDIFALVKAEPEHEFFAEEIKAFFPKDAVNESVAELFIEAIGELRSVSRFGINETDFKKIILEKANPLVQAGKDRKKKTEKIESGNK